MITKNAILFQKKSDYIKLLFVFDRNAFDFPGFLKFYTTVCVLSRQESCQTNNNVTECRSNHGERIIFLLISQAESSAENLF